MSSQDQGNTSFRFRRLRCLILEDDESVADLLVQAVKTTSGEAVIAPTIAHAKALIAQQDFDLCVLDCALPDGKGSAFFGWLREQGVLAPCLMLTGAPDLQTAIELTRNGLFEYLAKPMALPQLLDCLQRAAAHSVAIQSSLDGFGLVDCSRAMRAVRRRVRQAAANPRAPILLTGETGVGKDLVARLIHQLTFQKAEAAPSLISLNCSTLPAEMFEAELFGATKGAYTGAHQNRIGLAEAAQGGTLFLDEIGEVPLFLQAKLLQFLETREFRRLGDTATLHFSGRIIAATNRPLQDEVQAGRFRADLLYRLDVLNIHIPPLRERREDVPALIEFQLDALGRKYERSRPLPKPEDLTALQGYDFPGNVRELRNILERSLLQTPADAHWLELDHSWQGQRVSIARLESPPTLLPPARRFEAGIHSAVGAADPSAQAVLPPGRRLSPIDEQEYTLIRRTLIEEQGHIRRSAAKLDMSHQALLRRLDKWPELRSAAAQDGEKLP